MIYNWAELRSQVFSFLWRSIFQPFESGSQRCGIFEDPDTKGYKENFEKKEDLLKKLDTPDNLDYDSSNFSIDFPKILISQTTIRDKQSKIF